MSKNNLPKKMWGQFKDPKVQAKAQETRLKNKALRDAHKEAVEQAIQSAIVENSTAEVVIHSLAEISKQPNHPNFKWAVEQLVKMNVLKTAEPVKEKGEEKKEEMSAEDAISILKSKGF